MRFFESLETSINAVSEYSGEMVKWLFLPITFVVFYEVVVRYFFNAPTTWGYELTGYLFGTCSMLGGAYCLHFDMHVRMGLIRDRVSPRTRALIDILMMLFMLFFISVLLWKSSGYAYDTTITLERSTTVWAPPYWPYTIILPLAALMLLLQALSIFLKNIVIAVKGNS